MISLKRLLKEETLPTPLISDQVDTWHKEGSSYQFSSRPVADSVSTPPSVPENPLENYFQSLSTGPGIWKWTHYFHMYHFHLKRFRNHPTNLLEIGVYSGGSLRMWQQYLLPSSKIIGVDLESSCKAYEADNIQILIGDQEDRTFWRQSIKQLPPLNVVIDDGGHKETQQRVSFEELFPYLQPGGVYICEDIHRKNNSFAYFLFGLAAQLNDMQAFTESESDNDNRLSVTSNAIQQYIQAIHFYPFAAVIERNENPRDALRASKRGTQWQPFLK